MSEQNRNSGNEKENVRSLEDEDSVRRSTKKKKDSHPTTGNEDGAGLGSYFPEGFKAGMSYRDSLLGELPGAYEQAFFGSAMEDDLVSSDEEDDPPEDGEVVISIPRETKLRIRAPWSTSFIVKVFGRSVGYLFLVNRLKSLWKPIGGFSCVDLGLGFFLVKLDLADDFDRILKGGPWFIGEHFLSLRPWVPDFRPSEASVNTVACPVLRVDFNTASGTRGRFARLCIQLDLDKPLIKTVRVGKVRQAVIYEGIGLLCFHCGRIGHKIDKCPERGGTTSLTPTAPAQFLMLRPQRILLIEMPNQLFGPWMLVSRRKRQNKPKPDNFARSREENSVVTLAPGRAAQTNKDGNASTSSPEENKTSSSIPLEIECESKPKRKGLKGKVVHLDEEIIEMIRADPLHIWGWYQVEMAQAWQNIAPRVISSASLDHPPLEDLAWLQESSPFWNFHSDLPRIAGVNSVLRKLYQPSPELRLSQFLEEVLSATLPEWFTERTVLLSVPTNLNWVGNLASVALAQTAKCVPEFSMIIKSSEMRGTSYLAYQLSMRALKNVIWEMWPEMAWNAMEETGSLLPTTNPSFMSGNQIGLNVLTWNCRGVLNPCFRRALHDLLQINNPGILILTETRLGGPRAVDLAKSFPFDGFLCSQTIGFSGGIWILWKTNVVEINHLCSTEQEIHTSVKVFGSNSSWLLSAIYASPRRSERRMLWQNLSTVAGLHSLPWVMVGDFNDITSSDEKWGGNIPNASRISEYCDCMNNCNMIDLGFSGPKYTWTNGQPVSSLIMQRLDRAWANSEWRTFFPEAFVSHLTHTHSDHWPILLSLSPENNCNIPRPFRFESMWLSHPGFFFSVVTNAWSDTNVNLPVHVNTFTELVLSWNRHTFGNIFQRKKRVLARISGAQKALANQPSSSLVRLEKSLREEFNSILNLEEDFWALKSRVSWVVEGDRNTKFFHTSTIVRRRFNRISRLKNSMGEWVENRDQVMNLIQMGFSALFSTSHLSSYRLSASPNAPRLSDLEAQTLDAPLSIEEIKSSLWSLKPFKAPGPDGLHPGFFQRCWHIISDSVVKEVSHIFNCGRMPHYLNRTLISLIPKCPGPESLTQFRPISLCNTVYKIVTKAIVARIRPLLSNLISPFQAAFVPGRRGSLVVKIDLEKAYDRLEWSFIREVLLFFHFPNHLISLIMDCVSSSTISILFNGGRMEEFSPSRGLSLLSLMISCSCSGQKINLSKSKVLFSPNVQPDVVSRLCRILGVSSTQDIGRYLGFPLRSNGRNTTDFNFIVEKVQAKLTSWKSKLLSPAGRVVLIQSVTSSLPAYYMQNTALPSSICNDLDRLNRNFLWGSTSESKKMHLVGWDKVCRPKRDGGLGLYATKPRNKALLAKLNWRLHDEKESWICDLIEGTSFWDFSKLSIVLPPPICAQIKSHYLCTLSHLEDCIVWDTVDGSFSLRKAYQLANSKSFWNDIVPPQCSLNSFNLPFIDWLRANCTSSVIHPSSHIKWQTVFSFGLWNLWLRRNQVIFKPGTSFSNTPTSTLSFASEFFCLWGNGKNPKNSHSITIKWLLPPSGWAKLNTDGASSGNPGIAGGGGVLRDCRGAWVRGFSRHIDYASSVQAELRALLDGLLMTVELNIPYLEIEMDSLLAVDLILAVHPANAFLRSIVYDCRCLLEKFEGVSIKHIYREANVCADLLAKAGCDPA
uniref:CCHC-type domain-containing protein n=1 Tax=Fagus sylvatica TaxID=28930 RepID=A0A2N9GX50_FAGSY